MVELYTECSTILFPWERKMHLTEGMKEYISFSVKINTLICKNQDTINTCINLRMFPNTLHDP